MTIEKIDGVWADTGEKESTLTDEKKAAGFMGDDQPTIERMNFLFNRADQTIADIIRERINTYYPEATTPKKMISTGLYDESWGITSDPANVIEGGVLKRYLDLAVFFDSDSIPQLLVIDATDMKIEVWDARAQTLTDTSDALTDDLPSGGTELWWPVSICTDGTTVYGTFVDLDADPDEHHIQAWDIATWDVKPGWLAVSATGTALPGTGNAESLFRNTVVIVASATKLAVLNCMVSVTAAADPAVTIIDITDGTIDASGAGDCPTGSSLEPLQTPCSDGTNIYFATYKSEINVYVCSATIANPQVGCGGDNYPRDMGGQGHGRYLVSCGEEMVVSVATNNLDDTTDYLLSTHTSADADLDNILVGQDSQASPLEGSEYLLGLTLSTCFDGLNIWILGKMLNTAAGGNLVLIRVDASRLSLSDTDKSRQLSDVTTGVYFIDPDYEYNSSVERTTKCVFDGRDIWCVFEPDPSETNSGKIYRLPLAALRS